MIKNIYFYLTRNAAIKSVLILVYKLTGRKPWTLGYVEYKWKKIKDALNDRKLMDSFKRKKIPERYGIGLDERVVEYPWVMSNMKSEEKSRILDAGSVFNYYELLSLPLFKHKELTIFTFAPERENFSKKRISYVYGDLRNLIFKDDYFNEIVCQSTIEHVDMDNSMYGYNLKNSSSQKIKSYEYLKVISELYRVLAKKGKLLLTFPFGKYENQGFFQQFDFEMVQRVNKYLVNKGRIEINFIRYKKTGWNFASEEECVNSYSYNPHNGNGRGNDGAAHSRAVCCIKFIKE